MTLWSLSICNSLNSSKTHTQTPNMEKRTTHTSSYDVELAFLGCDCAWLCINSSMLWHAPCEELCTPTGRCAGVADTGINKEQKGNIMRTLIPAGHLWKRACLQMTAGQYCAPLCCLKKKKSTREMQQQQQRRLISSKDFAEPAQSHFCEGR